MFHKCARRPTAVRKETKKTDIRLPWCPSGLLSFQMSQNNHFQCHQTEWIYWGRRGSLMSWIILMWTLQEPTVNSDSKGRHGVALKQMLRTTWKTPISTGHTGGNGPSFAFAAVLMAATRIWHWKPNVNSRLICWFVYHGRRVDWAGKTNEAAPIQFWGRIQKCLTTKTSYNVLFKRKKKKQR